MKRSLAVFFMTKNASIISIISFLTTVAIARFIGPAEFGAYVNMLIISSIIMVLTLFGTDQTAALLRARNVEISQIFKITHAIRLFIGIVVILLCSIIFKDNPLFTLYILALSIPNYSFGYIYEITHKQVRFSYIQNIEKLTYLISVIVMIYLEVLTLSSLILFYGMVASISVIFQYFEVRNNFRLGNGSTSIGFKEILKINFPLVIVSLIALQYGSVNRLFLEDSLGTEALGIYSASWQLVMIGTVYQSLINRLWRPELSESIEKKNLNQFINSLVRYFLLGILPLAIAGVLLSVFGDNIISVLFDERFYATKQIIPYVALYIPIIGAVAIVDLVWISTGRTYTYLLLSSFFSMMIIFILWKFSSLFDLIDLF